MKIRALLISLLLFVLPVIAGDTSVTPYLHEWYDARTTQMKFNFDYNQYDYRLTQTAYSTFPIPATNAVSYTSDTVQLSQSAPSAAAFGAGVLAVQFNTIPSIWWSLGNETHIMFTAAFNVSGVYGGPVASFGSACRMGVFDANDGVGLIYSAAVSSTPGSGSLSSPQFGIFTRNNGVETVLTSTGLNGTAPSTPTGLNLYRIVVTEKAEGPIVFEFYNSTTNLWTVIHEISFTTGSRGATSPFMRTLTLPVCARLDSNVNITASPISLSVNTSINTTSWHVMSVGESFKGGEKPLAAYSGAQSSSLTETHVMTIKNNGLSGATKTSYIPVKIKDIGTAGSTVTSFQVYKNATVAGTTFANVDTNNSVMQVSATGSEVYTVGTGVKVFATTYMPGTGDVPPYTTNEEAIFVYPGETLTITSLLPFDTTGKSFASIMWDELF
jgi:hypothetical protein